MAFDIKKLREFEDYLTARNDAIDNAAHSVLAALANDLGTEGFDYKFPADVCDENGDFKLEVFIEEVVDMGKKVLESHHVPVVTDATHPAVRAAARSVFAALMSNEYWSGAVYVGDYDVPSWDAQDNDDITSAAEAIIEKNGFGVPCHPFFGGEEELPDEVEVLEQVFGGYSGLPCYLGNDCPHKNCPFFHKDNVIPVWQPDPTCRVEAKSAQNEDEINETIALIHKAIDVGVLTAAGKRRVYVAIEEEDGDSYFSPVIIEDAAKDLICQGEVDTLRKAVETASLNKEDAPQA